MPPWARAPRISYWPATISPRPRLGSLVTKSKAVRQLPQKPLTRPGFSGVPRPTGLPQVAQLRSSSGTMPISAAIASSDMTAAAGSPTVVGVIDTSPRPMPVRAEPVRRDALVVVRLLAVAVPAPGILVEVSGGIGMAIDGMASLSGSTRARTGAVRTGPPVLSAAKPQVSQ